MKWWKKVFFRMFKLAIINAMVLYFDQNESLAKKRSSHKHFRISLIHERVQPLFTQRADTTSPLSVSTPGRKAISTEKRLKGKHFPTSRFPERKCCVSCGYKKNSSGKQTQKKTCNYCPKYDAFICKECFECFHTKSNMK